MKRLILLCFVLFAGAAFAQVSPQIQGAGAPTNPCVNGGQQYVDQTNHVIYGCPANGQNWVNLGLGNTVFNMKVAAGAPSNPCLDINLVYQNSSNGDFYDCPASGGNWNKVSAAGGGSGTVTNIATTGPIGGGPITTTGTLTCTTCATTTNGGALSGTAPVTLSAAGAIACATCVTSAAALTSNAVVIGGGAQASSAIAADTTTTHALFATGTAPAFRALAAADIPTLIPIANVGSSGLSGTAPVTISAAGAIGCATCLINNGANTGTSAITLDMSLAAATALRVPNVAGAVCGTTLGSICYDTTVKNLHFSMNGADFLTVGESAAIASGFLPKSNSATLASMAQSSISDSGTAVSSAEIWKFGTAGGNADQDLTMGSDAAAMAQQTTATCTNVTGMTWTILASKNYRLVCEIPITFAATATVAFCLGGPGTPTSYNLDAYGDLGAAGAFTDINTIGAAAYLTKTAASGAVGASTQVAHVNAFIQNGATASGTALTLQTAANGTNGITIGANDWCDLKQVN